MKKLITISLCALGAICFSGVTQAQTINTVAGNGGSGFSGDHGAATAANFNNPFGVALDKKGNLYVSDWSNNRVRMISKTTGIITTVAGNGTGAYGGDNGPATNASLYAPAGLAFDTVGNLYISDRANCRIRKVDTLGIITTFAGNGAFAFGGDNGPATSASVFAPMDVTADLKGNIFIADFNNQRVRKVNAAGIITTIAGNDSFGFSGDGQAATAATVKLYGPTGVKVDGAGNVYIADSYNKRVRVVNTSGIINTFAGNGASTSSGDGGAATAAGICVTNNMAIDSDGSIYLASCGGFVVRKINSNGIISTYAGTGVQGFAGDNGPAANAQFNFPTTIAIDKSGNLYVGDQDNDRVRKITKPTTSTAVIGTKTDLPFSVYPNPCDGNFTINIESPAQESVEVVITDISGRKVQNFSPKPNQPVTVRLGETKGVYILSILTDGQLTGQQMLVVN